MVFVCATSYQNITYPSRHELHKNYEGSVVFVSKTLAEDPLSPESCMMRPPRIGLVCPVHITDDLLNWDLGNMKARSIPLPSRCAPLTILTGCIFCWKPQQCLGRGNWQKILTCMPGPKAFQQNIAQSIGEYNYLFPRYIQLFVWGGRKCNSKAIAPNSDAHVPIVGTSCVGPESAQAHCELWNLSMIENIILPFYGMVQASVCSLHASVCLDWPWPHHQIAGYLSLGPLSVGTKQCMLGTPSKNCFYGNALTRSSSRSQKPLWRDNQMSFLPPVRGFNVIADQCINNFI